MGLQLGQELDIRQIFLVRHGESRYEETEPDLTPNGIEQVKRVARYIARVHTSYGSGPQVTIFSSPAPRAKASAQIIQEYLQPSGLPVHPYILYEVALRHFDIRDAVVFHKKLQEEAAHGRHLDACYWDDPFFEDPSIVEPRPEVTKRSYRFLGPLLRESHHFAVVVTHFEVITPYLPLFGFERQIGYGEWLHLGLTEDDVVATLRGVTHERNLSELTRALS